MSISLEVKYKFLVSSYHAPDIKGLDVEYGPKEHHGNTEVYIL